MAEKVYEKSYDLDLELNEQSTPTFTQAGENDRVNVGNSSLDTNLIYVIPRQKVHTKKLKQEVNGYSTSNVVWGFALHPSTGELVTVMTLPINQFRGRYLDLITKDNEEEIAEKVYKVRLSERNGVTMVTSKASESSVFVNDPSFRLNVGFETVRGDEEGDYRIFPQLVVKFDGRVNVTALALINEGNRWHIDYTVDENNPKEGIANVDFRFVNRFNLNPRLTASVEKAVNNILANPAKVLNEPLFDSAFVVKDGLYNSVITELIAKAEAEAIKTQPVNQPVTTEPTTEPANQPVATDATTETAKTGKNNKSNA